MKNIRIATLHDAEKDLAQGSMESQQDLLEDFLRKEGIIPEHSYYIRRNLDSEPSPHVYETLLRDASLGRFDLLLVKNFEQIPPCDETNLPQLRIYSLEDQEMREIGTLDQSLTETENDTPDIKRAVIYYGREQSAETFEVPAIEEQCM
jgi:hypothetical protein